jgi:hypothetical protein
VTDLSIGKGQAQVAVEERVNLLDLDPFELLGE